MKTFEEAFTYLTDKKDRDSKEDIKKRIELQKEFSDEARGSKAVDEFVEWAVGRVASCVIRQFDVSEITVHNLMKEAYLNAFTLGIAIGVQMERAE